MYGLGGRGADLVLPSTRRHALCAQLGHVWRLKYARLAATVQSRWLTRSLPALSVAVQTAPLGGAFKSVPYGAELFVKDRWCVGLSFMIQA